ncbi:MAG: IS1634 family transposase [Candidatus Rokuibacteriota bacterium]|nr:MAG: IS1634 family transposase [Candidatus Rokubacteria bacterium]
MYLRTVKVRGSTGITHEYLRLIESYWEDGQAKQRIVSNLGRKDLLAPHLEALVRLLDGERVGTAAKPRGDAVQADQAACWGPMLVARALWRELGLETIFDACEGRRRRADTLPLADRALVLATQRLCDPQSEHRLAAWLETDFVCDRRGRRLLPQWKAQGRVRVDLTWLQRWYRTLDDVLPHKTRVETELFARLRDLFALEAEMVFYDLTSTYFEGAGPAGLAVHGYSRDGKPRNRQVLVGVVMINGWPIAHHVFRGNRHDDDTVSEVLTDLERRFGLKRVVFVGDRGMVTTANLATLKARRHGYLVGLQRRRREEIFQLIKRATGPWTECPVGITAREHAAPPKTLVQEVAAGEAGVRIFVVHSDERLAYERAMRERDMERTREALDRVQRRVAAGKLKAPEKIGEAAGRILTRHHGHRYFGWELRGRAVHFFEHPVHLERERAYEGKYLIQTEEPDLTPVEAVQAYKELSEVERAFRELKDIIELRPIYHRRPERVRAHIFMAALAFLLDRALEKKLKAARVAMSAAEALKALRTIHVVELTVGATRKRGVTAGSTRARQVLAALAITDREPPTSAGGLDMATC